MNNILGNHNDPTIFGSVMHQTEHETETLKLVYDTRYHLLASITQLYIDLKGGRQTNALDIKYPGAFIFEKLSSDTEINVSDKALVLSKQIAKHFLAKSTLFALRGDIISNWKRSVQEFLDDDSIRNTINKSMLTKIVKLPVFYYENLFVEDIMKKSKSANLATKHYTGVIEHIGSYIFSQRMATNSYMSCWKTNDGYLACFKIPLNFKNIMDRIELDKQIGIEFSLTSIKLKGQNFYYYNLINDCYRFTN